MNFDSVKESKIQKRKAKKDKNWGCAHGRYT